ncbi:MAG TPA: leucyl aminopeptidase [Isosphaeraceae bacterium]|nr:leucyl aminopeptidase [Isosphaeraceae bacterium]
MNISASTDATFPADAQWLAVPLFDDDAAPPASTSDTPLGPVLARLIEARALGGGLGDVTPILGASDLGVEGVQAYGLGKREKFGPGAAFSAGVALAKRLAGKPRGKVAVLVPDEGDQAAIASSLTEGLVVGTVGPDLRKQERGRHPFESLVIVAPGTDPAALDESVRRGEVVGNAVNSARELVNTPPAEKTPALLAERVKSLAIEAGVKVEVWDERRIESERFGGLMGVASGSDHPPRFVVLSYHNGGDRPTIALVGKGVTFDSGGLSLKPSASMEDMKSDMTGAAVVAASIAAAARLKLPVNVVGYLPMTENMTGGRAMKLGDVLTMRNGKTVEVLNTDAEGRLILADALSYAVESNPCRILDLATLTGACMVALGTRYAGLFGNDDDWVRSVELASKSTGERTWRLPLDDDFLDALKSTVSDLKNVGGKWGGAITAAKFLEQFVGETPWAHLDIAGPSWADSDSPTRDAGGTGCFVRTLVALMEALARPS